MKSLPDDVSPYRRTPEFDQDSVPKGLLSAHRTKAGTWGRIVVLEGRLRYTIHEPEPEEVILNAGDYGVVEPTMSHEVKPLGAVRFYVEFNR